MADSKISNLPIKANPVNTDSLVIVDNDAAPINKKVAAGTLPVKQHQLAGSEHTADTLANLNSKITDANLDDASNPRTPVAHDLGGAEHNADTLANLNAKITDATLDTNTNPRPAQVHAIGSANHAADTLSNLNAKISDAVLSGDYQDHYFGTDTPGAGVNTLNDGQARLWHNLANGKKYIMARVGVSYYLVELGVWT